MTGFLAICLATAAYSLVAKRLSTTILTAPIIFLFFGALLSVTNLMPHEVSQAMLHPVAEITLVVLLFLDAAQIDLMALRQRHI